MRRASEPSTLVAGTSASIHTARMIGKTRAVRTPKNQSGGGRNHAPALSRPLIATTTGASYGGRNARRHSARTATVNVAGGSRPGGQRGAGGAD